MQKFLTLDLLNYYIKKRKKIKKKRRLKRSMKEESEVEILEKKEEGLKRR